MDPKDVRFVPVNNAKTAIMELMTKNNMLNIANPTWAPHAGNLELTLNMHRYNNGRTGADPFRQEYELYMPGTYVVS